MRTYQIMKKQENMDWNSVPAAQIDHLQWSPDVDIQAQAQVCWDTDALYVRLKAREQAIRAELTGPLQEVCEDSCLEFFFGIGGADRRYFNLEFNPNTAVYVGFGSTRERRLRILVSDQEKTFSPVVKRFEDGWEISYQIPVTFIREFYPDFALTSGLTLFGNFFKCGDKTDIPHYLTWNAVSSEEPDYHRPQDFGKLLLE